MHYAMKTYEWVQVTAPPFFISALDGGEWSASRLNRFTLVETASGIHWVGSWFDPEPVWTLWSRENSLAPPPAAGNRVTIVTSMLYKAKKLRSHSKQFSSAALHSLNAYCRVLHCTNLVRKKNCCYIINHTVLTDCSSVFLLATKIKSGLNYGRRRR
jgi:hypothetical protein